MPITIKYFLLFVDSLILKSSDTGVPLSIESCTALAAANSISKFEIVLSSDLHIGHGHLFRINVSRSADHYYKKWSLDNWRKKLTAQHDVSLKLLLVSSWNPSLPHPDENRKNRSVKVLKEFLIDEINENRLCFRDQCRFTFRSGYTVLSGNKVTYNSWIATLCN